MKKLLFLVTEDGYFVSHRLPLAIAARAAGFEVVVATRIREKAAAIAAAGIRVIPFEMDRRNMNPLRELPTLFRLWRLYRRERPDIVHHVALKPVLLGGLAARLAGVRAVVGAVAGLGFLFSGRGRTPLAARLVKGLLPGLIGQGRAIVQNPEDAAMLADCGVAASRIRLIRGAGVDTAWFTPAPEPPGIPLVVLPARMLRDKGVVEFVAAARRLREQGVSARFALVGAPDPANPASVSAAELHAWAAAGAVECWGQREDMREVYAACHVVCLPSYREGLPKALLEAAACGRPIVATDAPGCREIVRDGDNGLLVPVRDAAALAIALRRLLEDGELRRCMGARGRELAVAAFSVEQVVSETLALYRELT
ncbi:MAG: glycosyltransferase family 4 protein [Sulfuricellaceae bacterium]|nr:glycosyltransferase family 4 protein [Sulfuricellaceae bacterium]